MSLLDEITRRLTDLPEEKKKEVIKTALEATKHLAWIPNAGPQTDAYHSKADILLYGGQPGGGKTALLLGLALNSHSRSLIVRKQFADLDGVVDNLVGILGSSKGVARGGRPKYRSSDGKRLVSFQGLSGGDGGLDAGKQGNAFDFVGADEAAQLTENEVRALIAWNRRGSGVPESQRCRIVLASNPPLNSTGDWLGDFFRPWFDPLHPNPAKFGELRWFYFDDAGKSVETEQTTSFELSGKTIYPHSRTYIPASLRDNPFLSEDEYQKNLQAFQEPYRSIIMSGNFLVARKDQDYQLIPTEWVREAMERWKKNPHPPKGVPMCAMGCDMVGGGKDEAIIARRYDYWFDEMISVKGQDVPDGNLSGVIFMHRIHDALIAIDMGSGYGQATWNSFKENIGTNFLYSYKGSEAGIGRTKDKQLGFYNKRSQAYWKFREALDPSQIGGSPVCLPPDPKLLADLTAPTFNIESRGIIVEKKDEVIKKLGRSPDRGDAVIMAWDCGRRGLLPVSAGQSNFRNSSLPTKAVMDNRKSIILKR